MKIINPFLFVLLFSTLCVGQSKYPQDYFRYPLDIPIILSGTFGELRSNHFHSGLDIKTQQVEGKKVYTAAKGYVSRIKISHWGYGKALYITHPNGYTTVYGHLQKFSPRIETYIKAKQYAKESFEIEVFPAASELPIAADEIVAYSGNTGGSGGPHLHFEIRDGNARPLNPMLFGIDTKDTTKPAINAIYAYPVSDSSHVNQSTKKIKLRLIPLQSGDFKTENIEAYGKIGFGINTTDRQDLAANNNGVYEIETSLNGQKNFELVFNRFSFSESKHINRLIDYEYYKNHNSRIQKLFVEKNNPLSLYKNINERGYLNIPDSTSSIYKIKVTDFDNNDVVITIPIKGKKETSIQHQAPSTTAYYIVQDQAKTLNEGNISVYFPSDTFYDNLYLDFEVNSDTLKLHNKSVPTMKKFTITYDISNYANTDKSKLYIAKLTGTYKKYVNYVGAKRNGNKLSARTSSLGTYLLATDTQAPTITPTNFSDGKWLSNYRYLKVKISDDSSGISNYRATVNDKWILMEYDAKKGTLTYDFNDNIITDTKNNFKLIVTDNVGNSSKFEATFFRK